MEKVALGHNAIAVEMTWKEDPRDWQTQVLPRRNTVRKKYARILGTKYI